MKIVIVLFFFVNSQLLLEQTQKEYSFQPTLYGFVPYGRSITGNMYFVKDLCTYAEASQKIIITDWSKQCSISQQLWNANQALAVIYSSETLNEQSLFTDRSTELHTVLTVHSSDIIELKLNANSKITLNFPIKTKLQKPVIEYIVYSITQQTEVLNLIEEFRNRAFNFDFNVIYYTTHLSKVDYLCRAKSQEIGYKQDSTITIYGGKIDCRSEFEKTYLIMGNFDEKMTRTQILQQNIQQLCVLKTYGVEKWNQFRSQFTNTCLQYQTIQSINECAANIKEPLSIEELQILQCQSDSFSKDTQKNSILQEQDQLSTGLSINYYMERSTLAVNGQRIYGNYSLDPKDLFIADQSGLFLAICESYTQNHRPTQCPNETNSMIQPQGCNCKGISGYIIILIAIIIFLTLITLFIYVIKRRQINCQKIILIIGLSFRKICSKFKHQNQVIQEQQGNESEMAQQAIAQQRDSYQRMQQQSNESKVQIILLKREII